MQRGRAAGARRRSATRQLFSPFVKPFRPSFGKREPVVDVKLQSLESGCVSRGGWEAFCYLASKAMVFLAILTVDPHASFYEPHEESVVLLVSPL